MRSSSGRRSIRSEGYCPDSPWPEADLRRGFYASTEFSFLVAGLAIIVMAWAAHLLGAFSGGTGDSHGGMVIYFWCLFMLLGIAFAGVGAAYDHHRRLMSDAAFAKRDP